MSIVQPVNFQPITAEFKTPDVRLQTSSDGAEIAEGISKTLSSFAKSYAGFKQDQAAANVLSAYESDAASVQEAMQNSDMSLVEKKLAVEGLAKRHPGVKHSDRAGINKLLGLDLYGDLYKEQESDKVAAQSELDKEKVTSFETQYPGLAASLTYDEKLSASNNLQIARSTVAGYLTYQNELDDLNKTVFRGSLDVIALQDLRNYLSTVNLSSINIDQLADVEIQLTNALSSIVDIREADDIAKELIEPHRQIAERYSETSEIQTKALNAAFLNKIPAIARKVLDNPPLLQYLPPNSRNAVDQILAKASATDYPSLRQTFAYRGASEQDPNGVAQTQSSFNAGWVLAHGASPDDIEVARNITMDVNKNVREMQNVSLTGTKQPEPEKIVETVANMNKEDRIKEINNDKAMYINMAKINSAYHETQDPVLKEKLRNEAKETYRRSVSVALGNLMADIKEAEDKDVVLRYDPAKGYARVYEVVGKAGEFSSGLLTAAKKLATGKSLRLEEDLLKERTYNKGFLGFGGEAEKSYMRQVGNIVKNYDETIERIADTWHQDPIINDKEREEIWQEVIRKISGGDSIAFSGGYLYDVGEVAEPVLESVSTATQAASEAPVQALLSAGEAVGEGLAKAKILGDEAGEATLELFRLAGEGAEDIGNRVLKTYDEVYEMASTNADEAGKYVLELLRAAGEGVKEGGRISEEVYEEARAALSATLTAIVEKAVAAGESTVSFTKDLTTALENFANATGKTVRKDGKELKASTKEAAQALLKLPNSEEGGILAYEEGVVTQEELMKSKGAVRSVRNFNPGNLKQLNIAWNDMRPTAETRKLGEETFESFKTPRAGVVALAKDLITKIRGLSTSSPGVPLDTMGKIIPVYAPSSENNVEAYLENIKNSFGIAANQVLDWQNQEMLEKAVKSIIVSEAGDIALGFYERHGDISNAVAEAIKYNSSAK